MIVRVEVSTISDYLMKIVCCIVVFGTLVGVSVLNVIWCELLMTSAISCPLLSSVYECQGVECAFTSLVSGMFGLLPSTLISIHIFHPVFIIFPHHMSIPSQPTTSNDSCDWFNFNQVHQLFTSLKD